MSGPPPGVQRRISGTWMPSRASASRISTLVWAISSWVDGRVPARHVLAQAHPGTGQYMTPIGAG